MKKISGLFFLKGLLRGQVSPSEKYIVAWIFPFLLFIPTFSFSQNLVGNPGFETYSSLPVLPGQWNNATGWSNCGGGTPDFFHTNGSGIVQLPNCYVGTVYPYKGDGIMGLVAYASYYANAREYISANLISALVPGSVYNISFFITNGLPSDSYGGQGIDNFSIAFSIGPLAQFYFQPLSSITPQLTVSNILYDTAWEQISFQYLADAAYDHITFGNFADDASTTVQVFDSGTNALVYYFLDSINVEDVNGSLAFIASDLSFCEASCIAFADQSTNNPTSWQWVFNGGLPSTSSIQNPINICYNTPGTYNVTLITSNAYGSDTLTLYNYIIVYAVPAVPVITQSNDTLMSSVAYSYQWFMNGNLIPAATNQQFTILQSGDYSVIITDALGCSAGDTLGAVLLLPQSAFSSGTTGGCPGSCFDFANASLNATSYQWFFTGGNPASSTQQNPWNICYANPGVYDVTLIASCNFAADTLTLYNYITVYTTPVQPVITQSNDTLTSSAAFSYQWFMNGNMIPAATNQQLIIMLSGDYRVMITDALGCSASDTLDALLLFPQSAFNSGTISGCPGSCFDFTNASLNAASYQWFFTGGNPASSTQQNPANICYAIPGLYDVVLIASSNFASDTMLQSAYITIFVPLPVFISQNGNLLTCTPAANTYQWLLNGNQIPGATSQTLFITQTGIYIVEVIDLNGCAFSDTIIVNTIPSPNFAATDTSLCEKFCTNFFDQSNNIPTAWQWIFPGGDPASSSEQNPANICFNNPGVYNVTLITTNDLGNDTLTLINYIDVHSTPPFPEITQNGHVLTSSSAASYQWQLNTVDIPGATYQSYTVMQTGFYTVVISDSNGCKNSATQNVLISALEEVSNDAGIVISPNPSNGSFMVEWLNGQMADQLSIAVVNTIGKKVYYSDERITSENFKKSIDLNSVVEGLYFLEIKSGEEFYRKKVVITR
ncbi:MAG TPA: PKD domain-containing protein [Chitinophagales bacterium]|nr:PKD domain-containing protein [Chitinophagales bacterium]